MGNMRRLFSDRSLPCSSPIVRVRPVSERSGTLPSVAISLGWTIDISRISQVAVETDFFRRGRAVDDAARFALLDRAEFYPRSLCRSVRASGRSALKHFVKVFAGLAYEGTAR